MLEANAWTVFLVALLTAIATGVGAVPFLFAPAMSRAWLGVSNAVAAGLMLAASHALIYEGLTHSAPRLLLGTVLGLGFLAASRRSLDFHPELQLGQLAGADAVKALMVVGVMTLHSLTEGIGVGVSFGGGEALGIYITSAIAVHNIPEGLAISLVLVPRGEPAWRAGLWSVFSSLPQPLMAVPAFLFVLVFQPLLPVGLGFAAGAMIWLVFCEILPEALADTSPRLVATVVTLSLTGMIAFQELLRAWSG